MVSYTIHVRGYGKYSSIRGAFRSLLRIYDGVLCENNEHLRVVDTSECVADTSAFYTVLY